MSFLFALSFVAGGIVNAVYSADYVQLNDEVCLIPYEDYSYDITIELPSDTCQHLDIVVATEYALAVS